MPSSAPQCGCQHACQKRTGDEEPHCSHRNLAAPARACASCRLRRFELHGKLLACLEQLGGLELLDGHDERKVSRSTRLCWQVWAFK
mmetsp:Transcript_52237/g.134755  ORF Transcript_52237/g.134755 Transcript_52237/m.134755 type:complete len:87 (+) Transcript_52237:1913-2173(+)